jgi:hypothetical protein
MTVTSADLDLRIRTFKSSSSFTPGDAWSFSIVFDKDLQLPGKYDSDKYIKQLNIDLVGKSVLVVCPGNAGLCVSALKNGASTVVALEPRNIYHQSLISVSEFASEVIGATFNHHMKDGDLAESFDIVIWSEGLEDVPHPKNIIKKVLGSMKTGSTLYFEVNHGYHGVLPESINSWRPTKEAFKESLDGLASLKFMRELSGRGQTRTIYTIKNNSGRKIEIPAKTIESVKEVTKEIVKKNKNLNSVTSTKKDEILNNASDTVQKLADKVKKIIPVQEEGEFDSVYEGLPLTPKSKDKKKIRAKKRKVSKETKPKS